MSKQKIVNKLQFLPYTRFLFFKFPKGWKDLGQVKGNAKDNGLTTYVSHELCRTIAHVGLRNDQLFQFCPRCGIVLEDTHV
jgi:hypothetical protein